MSQGARPAHSRLARCHPIFSHHLVGLSAIVLAAACLAGCGGGASNVTTTPPPPTEITTYSNPLLITILGGSGSVNDCPDPTIIHGQQAGDQYWYMYCTTGPLNDMDMVNGNYNSQLIKMSKSLDLANWTYIGNVFATRPPWVAGTAGLWAPDAKYFSGKYYLYYAASETSLPGAGSAIGVATSSSPTGPWIDAGRPVVYPEDAACCTGSRRALLDPDVIDVQGQKYIYFGSFFGGLSVRTLTADGLTSDPASEIPIDLGDRYEGPNIILHDGYYYLFGSSTDCCHGPLTGYTVLVGRSANPLGPFVDRNGTSFLDPRTGGTPVLAMNGNRWVGPGHETVFTDFAGQDWMLYHAIDRNDPYFSNAVGFTRRPVLMDPIDWVNGWPTVRGGFWVSDSSQAAAAAQPGEPQRYVPVFKSDDQPGSLIASASDDFNQAQLSPQWSWVRPPDPSTFRMTGSAFEWDTQAGDLYIDINSSSVLTESAPAGDYMVEAKVAVNVPPSGSGYNYSQAGLVIYRDDDNYIKLEPVPINETRQIEFAKEISPVPAGYPRYGYTVVGPPGDWTWLRIARRQQGAEEAYTPYTSNDGVNWTRGGTWTHVLGAGARIGLVSQSGAGFTADFDYVHVCQLQ